MFFTVITYNQKSLQENDSKSGVHILSNLPYGHVN